MRTSRLALRPIFRNYDLSQRQLDVLHFLLKGQSTNDIARSLNLSPNTVKTYLRQIMLKMQVHSRTQILAKLYGNIP